MKYLSVAKKIACFMLLIIVFLSMTENVEAKIHGIVKDIFGKGIDGVSVQIENTGFQAKTNKSGKYSIDYVPGNITLLYSKSGYTTHKLCLSIYEKAKFPAAPIEMWPIPKAGIYYLDNERGKIIKVESYIVNKNKKVQKPKVDYGIPTMHTLHHIFLAKTKGDVNLKSGKLVFIDSVPKPIRLFKLKEEVILHYRTDGYGVGRKDIYNGFIKDEAKKIGEENLTVRTIELEDGHYAWVELTKKQRGMLGESSIEPADNGLYFPFYIGVKKKTTRPENKKDIAQSPIDINSKYYTFDNPYYNSGYGGQCTAFAWGRAYEKTGIKLKFKGSKIYPSAKYWYRPGPIDELNLSLGNEPRGDSVAIWDGNPGHVAYIEKVEDGYVYFNEANFDSYEDTKYGGGYDGFEQPLKINVFENRRGGTINNFLGYLYLVNNSASSNAYATDLNEMLIATVQSCDIGAVQKLLAQGADVNAQDKNTITVLMYATCCGNKSPDLFYLLLGNGADPNMRASKYRGTTPLIAAAMEGFPDQVKALLEKGADPSQVDDAGKTALMYAEEFGRKDAVAVLKAFVAPK